MLYKSYYEKTQRLSEKLAKVYKKRVPIIIVLTLIALAAAALVAAKGLVVSDSSCPDSVVYGERLDYSANAFLSDVSYEYRSEAGGEWSTAHPSDVGSYRVRAVAETSFGGVRYGNEYSFAVTPRPITVTIEDQRVPWGDTPRVAANLLYDHVIDGTVIYEDLSEKEAPRVWADVDSLSITDAAGNDMSANYTVAETPIVDVIIVPRDIQITVEDYDRDYNGLELTYDGYELTGGSLAVGDSIAAVICNDSITAVGTLENTPEIRISMADGTDVTRHYNIDLVAGKLTVTARPLIISTGSGETVYDGKPLSNHTFTIDDSTPLADKHTAEVVSGSALTDVGEVINTLTLKLLDENGVDQTANYNYQAFIKAGTLTVTPRPAVISTEGGTYEYDGQSHAIKDATLRPGDLAEGDTLSFDELDFPEVRDVWVGEDGKPQAVINSVPYKIVCGERDVTANYDITTDWGTLTVTPCPITVITPDESWLYDATVHHSVAEDMRLVYGHDDAATQTADKAYTLPDKHTLSLSSYTEITDVLTETTENVCVVDIRSGQVNVNQNFDIRYRNGALAVTPRPLALKINDCTAEYNGKPLTSSAASVIGQYDLVGGHALTLQTTGSQLDADSSTNAYVEGSIAITTADGQDSKLHNYEILSVAPGTLTVTQRPIRVQAVDMTWIYDGKAHSEDRATLHYLGAASRSGETKPLADGHTETIVVTGECRDVLYTSRAGRNADGYGWVDNLVTSIVIYDASNEDVTENYDITPVPGKLTVLPRPVLVTTHGDEWMYDGTLHTDYQSYDLGWWIPEGFADAVWPDSDEYLMDGDLVELTYPTITEVCRNASGGVIAYKNEATVTLAVGDACNYIFKYVYGDVTVTPRPVTVTADSATYLYDGIEKHLHTSTIAWTTDDLLGNCLVDGHSYTADMTDAYTAVKGASNGVYLSHVNGINFVTISDGINDVSANYDITPVAGEITILPRPIKVTSATSGRVYNGYAYTDGNYTVTWQPDFDWTAGQWADIVDLDLSGNGVAAGQFESVSIIGSATYVKTDAQGNVADYPNTINDISIFGSDLQRVTDNYIITPEDGRLTIDFCPITVQTQGGSWIYNDILTALENCTLVGELGVVGNHGVTALNAPLFRDFGSYTNEHEVRITNKMDGEDATASFAITWDYGEVIIDKRPIYVRVSDTYKIYDGLALTSTDAFVMYEMTGYDLVGRMEGVDPHEMTVVTGGSQTNAGSSINAYIGATIRRPADGADVTKNYTITPENGYLYVSKRPIYVTTNSRTWVYDGTEHAREIADDRLWDIPWDDGTWSLMLNRDTTGGLVLGHEVNPVYEGFETYINVLSDGWGGYSAYENILLIGDGYTTIRTASGEDVTANYEIYPVYGSFLILPRPITVTSESQTWVYDGIGHDEYTTILTPTWWSEQLSNGIWATVTDPVNTQASALMSGHELKTDFGGIAYTDVYGYDSSRGLYLAYDNVFDVTDIVDSALGSQMGNYVVYTVPGELLILPRPITVTSGSAEKVYDGTPLTCQDKPVEAWSTPTGSQWNGVTLPTDTPVLSWQELRTTIIGSRTYVPLTAVNENRNIFDEALTYILDTRTNLNVSTLNYAITYVSGELTVKKRTVTVEFGNGTFVYNGLGQSCDDLTWTDPFDSHSVEIKSPNRFIDVGTYSYHHTMRLVHHTANGDVDATGSCEFVYHDGAVEITRRPVSFKIDDVALTYNGTAQSSNDATPNRGTDEGLVEIHTFVLQTVGSLTEPAVVLPDPGTALTYVEGSLVIYDEYGQIVTDNYELIAVEDGSLTILPAPITFKTADAEKVYDGTPLQNSGVSILSGKLFDGHTYTLQVTGSRTELGRTDNTYEAGSLYIVDGEGNSKNHCYNEKIELGTLEIKLGLSILLKTEDETRNPPTDSFTHEVYTVEYLEGALPDGYQLIVDEFPEHDGTPGKKEENRPKKVLVLDPDGEPVDIKVTYQCGTLYVRPTANVETVVGQIKPDRDGHVYLRVESYGGYKGSVLWMSATPYESGLNGIYSYNYLPSFYLARLGSERAVMEFNQMANGMLPYFLSTASSSLTTSDVDYSGVSLNGMKLTYTVAPDQLNWIATFLRLSEEEKISSLGAFVPMEAAYRDYVYEQYLTVDEETRLFMQSIINAEGLDADDPNILYYVATYIQHAATYEPDYIQELDAASNVAVAFLSQYREGKCTHYATAATLLFRTLGIPARYVEGYLVKDAKAGVWNDVISGGKNNMGHAWVEVYIDYLGWVPVEVTGGDGGIGEPELPIREITLQPADESKTYDGSPLTHPGTLQGLMGDALYEQLVKEGYTFTAKVDGSQLHVGTSDSTIREGTVVIKDRNKRDVTAYFIITPQTGTLEVTRASLTLKPTDLEKEWDGEPLQHETPGELDTEIAPLLRTLLSNGLTYTVVIDGSQTDVGISKSIIDRESLVIYDGDGNIVTDYFDVTWRDGLLTVIGVPLPIQPRYLDKVYDGKPLQHDVPGELNPIGLLGELLAMGYTYDVRIEGSITQIGIEPSTIDLASFRLYDEKGNDVTGRYEIIPEDGTLEVTGRFINLYLDLASKTYDGVELSYGQEQFHVFGGPLIETREDGFQVYRITDKTGDVYLLTIKFEFPVETDVFSLNLSALNSRKDEFVTYSVTQNGVDVTKNVSVRFTDIRQQTEPDYVVVAITKRQVTLTAGSGLLAYHEYVEGVPYTNDSWTVSGLADGHTVADIRVVGLCVTPGMAVENRIVSNSVRIVDAEGNDVTDNYNLNLVNGTLEIALPPTE